MRIARTVAEVPKPWGHPVGFVPTMGALHEGHLSLIRRAKEACGYCAISIFVNPTQFGPSEDLANYPRNEERDLALASEAGADFAFLPSVDEMYPGSSTSIRVGGVSEVLEGAMRPGHFEGVATVVAKLFNIVGSSHAFFGLKDFQQCVVIQTMVRDLNIPIVLEFCETVREANGLAMSSRNSYLSFEERELASRIYSSLKLASEEIREIDHVQETLRGQTSNLVAQGIEVQYLEYVNPQSLQPLASYSPGGRLLIAAKVGTTRLIDNIAV